MVMLQRVLLCSSESGCPADRQQQHVLSTTIFLKLYLSTNAYFGRIFSTAPELYYLKKKNQVVISIVYNKELTEVRTRDLHVTGC